MPGRRSAWGRKLLGLAFALLMIGLGSMWTAQGLGWLGAPTPGTRKLATLGPAVAGFGVALAYVSLRSHRS